MNSASETPDSNSSSASLQRLQRVLASAGIGSRRECELIILEGRVEVDGEIVATLGTKVDPEKQKIFVDGQRIHLQRLEYYMLNKPPGVLSTSNDPSGRARVIDLIKSQQRVYNVGRLDQSSEGLILVTNDGELANKLTHPKYGIRKTYHVKVDGVPTGEQLRSLEEGVYIAEGKAKAESAKLLRKSEPNSWLEIVLSEGKNREIRRILAKLGHKVRVLKRVAIGPLKLADLPVGAHRRLLPQEVKLLKRAADGLIADQPAKRRAVTRNVSKTKTRNEHQPSQARNKVSVVSASSFSRKAKSKTKDDRTHRNEHVPHSAKRKQGGFKQISQLVKPKRPFSESANSSAKSEEGDPESTKAKSSFRPSATTKSRPRPHTKASGKSKKGPLPSSPRSGKFVRKNKKKRG
jgi:23S rRNA pseudouridine2605 synthase